MSVRQDSAPYAIVIGAFAALLVGALVLTLLAYPIFTAFLGAAFWQADTAAGQNLLTYVGGLWRFWGAICLLAIVVYVWVRTRR